MQNAKRKMKKKKHFFKNKIHRDMNQEDTF